MTFTPEPVTGAATVTAGIVSIVTIAPSSTKTLDIQPTRLIATPTRESTMTLTATTTPSPAPTARVTHTPTPVPTIDPQVLNACGIGKAVTPGPDNQAIYFRTAVGDWYRTTDEFATTEWFAPAGELSPDLKTLVVFDCEGPGSICVAVPPQSQQVALPFGYEPKESHGGYVHWLPDNQRLVFMADYSLPGMGTIDRQLHLLDLRLPQLRNIAVMPGTNWTMSPLGTCVAYIGWDQDGMQNFYLVDVGTDEWHDWSAVSEESPDQWPYWNADMAWSPDGSRLAFDGMTGGITVWDLATGFRKWYDVEGSPSILKWSPDMSSLYFTAAGSSGGTYRWVLDLVANELRELGQTHSVNLPRAYLWLPNGREIIVSGRFGSLLLDTDDGATQKLTYPGSKDGWSIEELFLGPAT